MLKAVSSRDRSHMYVNSIYVFRTAFEGEMVEYLVILNSRSLGWGRSHEDAYGAEGKGERCRVH